MATSHLKDADTIRFCKPFDEDDADLIIRSKDNVHFRVHKLILRKASIVLDRMLIIPSDDEQDVVQTVSLEEDGATISGFLHLCYPLRSLEVVGLGAVNTLLGVCDQYQAHGLQLFTEVFSFIIMIAVGRPRTSPSLVISRGSSPLPNIPGLRRMNVMIVHPVMQAITVWKRGYGSR